MKAWFRRALGSDKPHPSAIDTVLSDERSWSGHGSRRSGAAAARPGCGGAALSGPSQARRGGDGPASPRRPLSAVPTGDPRPRPPFLSLKDAAAQLDARRAAAEAAAAALPPSAAVPPEPCMPALAACAASEPRAGGGRASSLPQPLAHAGGAAHAAAGSGAPGAPVSPDPSAAAAALRRTSALSSQPTTTALPSETSRHSSTTLDGTPQEQQPGSASDGEPSGSSLHLRFCGSGDGSDPWDSSGTSTGGDVAVVGRPGASLPLATAAGAASQGSKQASQRQPRQQAAQQAAAPAPLMRWHPALAGPSEQPAAAAQQQQQQPDLPSWAPAAAPPRASPFERAAARMSLAAALAADSEDDEPLPAVPVLTPGQSGVSLLTYQLRGASAASSACISREASARGGVARSREPSVSGGHRRTPVGGLSMALSRDSSIKGGTAREGSVNGGRLPGASPRERSVGGGGSGGAHTHRGLALADPRADSHLLQQHGSGPYGCSSGEHAGEPAPQNLSGLLDACEAAPRAAADPFAQCSRGSSRLPSCRPSNTIAEEEREALLEIQPQEVGSWAQRVTTFTNPAHAGAEAQHGGGPDPALLAAALQALAAPPGGSAQPPGSRPAGQLVGDSDSAEMQAAHLPPLLQQDGSWPRTGPATASGGSCGADGMPAARHAALAALSSSWDVADTACPAASLAEQLQRAARLGSSAPTGGRPCFGGRYSLGGASLPTAPGLGCAGVAFGIAQLAHDQAAAAAAEAAAQQEWSRDFTRRWHAVKKRAYLQALGLRALWRVNSPSDRHEPLELLTNDLPQYDNGVRRAWSASRLAPHREEALRRGAGASAALPAAPRRGAIGSLHKEPSLGTLLLGEVAEVC